MEEIPIYLAILTFIRRCLLSFSQNVNRVFLITLNTISLKFYVINATFKCIEDSNNMEKYKESKNDPNLV